MKSRIAFLSAGLILGFSCALGWRYVGTSMPPLDLTSTDPATIVETNDEMVSVESLESGSAPAGSIRLVATKQQAAEIELEQVVERSMVISRTVPGRLQYDDTRHVEVRLPTTGVVTEVRVKTGEAVQTGQVLALVSSPEIGNARADVLKCVAELQLADNVFAWKKGTCEGVERLVATVQTGRSAQSVADEMKTVSLGAYRASILEAYSRYQLAQSMADKLGSLGDQGAIPGRTVRQRLSEQESAQAALETVIEQANYEAEKECVEARVAVEDAQRRLQISQQQLNTLLGYVEDARDNHADEQLSVVEVRAPFDGTIESKLLAASERVTQGAALFVLANTSRLWVAADIREREWAALGLTEGQLLRLSSPALPGQELTATVRYIGRQVDPETHAVPLVASIENETGRLRPGQFVRVDLPLTEPRFVTAVPENAIVEHESQPFVFMQVGTEKSELEKSGLANEGCEYRSVFIEVGMRADGWAEVLLGVRPGDRVVTQGAFYLKSELLLESEGE